jgi:hypothetical protein
MAADQADSLSHVGVLLTEGFTGPAQHLLRGVDDRDVVAQPSEPDPLVPRSPTDVDDRPRTRTQVCVELASDELVADLPAQRPVVREEALGQQSVRIVVHVIPGSSIAEHRACTVTALPEDRLSRTGSIRALYRASVLDSDP